MKSTLFLTAWLLCLGVLSQEAGVAELKRGRLGAGLTEKLPRSGTHSGEPPNLAPPQNLPALLPPTNKIGSPQSQEKSVQLKGEGKDQKKKTSEAEKEAEKENDLLSALGIDDEFFKNFQSMFSKEGSRLFTNDAALRQSTHSKSPTEEEEVAKLDEHYKIRRNKMRFELEADLPRGVFLALQVFGSGAAVLTVTSAAGEAVLPEKYVPFITFGHAAYIPFPQHTLGRKGDVLEIAGENQGLYSDWSFVITKLESFSIEFETSLKVLGGMMDRIDVRATKNDTGEAPANQKRTQLFVSTSLDQQEVTGSEELKMLVNFNQEKFPEPTQFDFQPSGSLGTGLVKTLSPGSRFHCPKQSCEYRASIWAKQIEEVVFYVSELENGSTLKFNNSLVMTEEVEPGEHIFYRVEVPQGDSDLLFGLSPVEGKAGLLINPDVRPDNRNDYKYGVISNRTEQVIITAKEVAAYNFTGKVYYVAFESDSLTEPATFRFEVHRVDPKTKLFVEEGTAQGGVVAVDEIINYVADFQSFSDEAEEALDVKINFDTYFGNADVYVKECVASTPDCRVTQEDITNYKKLGTQKDQIFRYLRYDDGQSVMKKSEDGRRDHRSGNIHLQFNCQPFISRLRNPFAEFSPVQDEPQSIHNSLPSSITCQFALAVYGRRAPNNSGASYKLVVSGDNAHKTLVANAPVNLKVPPNRIDFFKLRLTPLDLMEYDGVRFKIVTIEGDFSLYFSGEHKYPNATTAFTTLNVTDEHFTSLQVRKNVVELNFSALFNLTQAKQIPARPRKAEDPSKKFFVNAQGKIERTNPSDRSKKPHRKSYFRKQQVKDTGHIFLAVASKRHSVFEVYIEPIKTSQPTILIDAEVLPPDVLVHRTIDFLYQFFLTADNRTVYYSNFIYKDSLQAVGVNSDVRLKITLNSKTLGLRLCVQTGTEKYEVEKPCRFSSDSGTLVISLAQFDFVNQPHMVISVQKDMDKDTAFDTLPIDFSLVAFLTGPVKGIELSLSGHPFTSVIDSFQSLLFQIDLTKASKNATILFESESISTKAELGVRRDGNFEAIELFDHRSYGVRIYDVKKFCEEFGGSSGCMAEVMVFSHSHHKTKFSLTHTFDDRPFVLKDGDFLSVPASTDQYFVYEVNKSQPLSFSVFSAEVKGVLYSGGLSHASLIKRQLSDSLFSFKTDIQNYAQITYTAADLKKTESSVLGFLYQPKFIQKEGKVIKKRGYILLKGPERTRVMAKTQVAELAAFYDLPETCARGEFRYYYINVHDEADFSVVMSMISGKASLYLAKGRSRLPSLTDHDAVRTCKHGGETELTHAELKAAGVEAQSYTLGVYCEVHSQFSLIYLPQFPGFIRLQMQKLVDMTLKKGREYFFDFFNHEDRYHTYLFSQDSDIRVSALDFRVSKKKNLLEVITEPSNWSEQFTFRHGSNPRKHFSENAVDKENHIIVKMEAVDSDSQMNFLIYDPERPIIVPAEKRVHFGMGAGDKVTFTAHLAADYEHLGLTLKMTHGQLDVWVSESLAALDSKSDPDVAHFRINSYDQIRHVFTPTTNSGDPNDIVLFNRVFVRVEARELTNFWFALHPKSLTRQLRPNEPELVRADETDEVYACLVLEPEDFSKIRDLEIQILTVKSFAQKPEFLFNSNDKIDYNTQPLFPMFVEDLQEWSDAEFLHYTVRPKIENGSYFIKIPPHISKIPYKITFVVNQEKTVHPNGFVRGYLRPATQEKEHKYNVYVPHKGEFRIVLETCEAVEITGAAFYPSRGEHHRIDLEFPKHLVQGFPYLAITNNPGQTASRALKEFDYPVFRAILDSPGLIEFKVRSKGAQELDLTGKVADYFLMTEFIPHQKELVLKDFVTIISPTNELDKYVTGHRYIDGGSSLEVSTKFPSFKPQLLKDYPHIKKIQITLFFGLFASDNVEAILHKCGLSSLFLDNSITKNVTRTFSVFEIDTERMPSYVSVAFSKEENQLLGDPARNRTVFCHAQIRFIEDENDEFDLTLEEKVTLVPYFVMQIAPWPKVTSVFLLQIAAGVIAGLLVAGFCVYRCSGEAEVGKPPQRQGYEAPKNGEWSTDRRLEMSSLSTPADRVN